MSYPLSPVGIKRPRRLRLRPRGVYGVLEYLNCQLLQVSLALVSISVVASLQSALYATLTWPSEACGHNNRLVV